jgi:sulfate transport system ATP-binding protein
MINGQPSFGAVFIRPHLLDVHAERPAGGRFRARVVRINPAGPLVKVELLTEWGESARAELTQDRYRAAPVTLGEDVFVSAGEEVSTKAS